MHVIQADQGLELGHLPLGRALQLRETLLRRGLSTSRPTTRETSIAM
jgi:hypothetical protein